VAVDRAVKEGSSVAFGAIIIGDEIMRGKREDKHFAKLVALLGARGLRLAWARYVGDDPERLTATLRETFASGDVVLSFGGIGATPDDRTRQCAAAALGLPLVLHPEAEALIRERFGAEATAQRLKMGEFPDGAVIVPNPFNRIPGFAIREHWFVPGFPVMAWPMVEWVLDSRYRHLHHSAAEAEDSVIVYDAAESTLTPLMESLEARFPGLKVMSLPSVGDGNRPRHIELGVRGAPPQVPEAMEALRRGVVECGGRWESRD
jgi:molybdopterin-biosynthesis enzyme MoeA-like protein